MRINLPIYLSRNGKLSLVRLTKSFPTIPNLRGIANANQNDERFKMWSVMLLCNILLYFFSFSMTPSPIFSDSYVFSFHFGYSSKEDGPHLAVVQDQGDPWRGRSKLLSALRLAKIHLIESSSMSYVSAIKLIRTEFFISILG